MPENDLRPVGWIGDSQAVIQSFPKDIRVDLGYAIDRVQRGLDPSNFKPRNDIAAGVIQLMAEDRESWYRVFCVATGEAVWVLHAFKKKSNETSKTDVENGKDAYRALTKYLSETKQGKSKKGAQ